MKKNYLTVAVDESQYNYIENLAEKNHWSMSKTIALMIELVIEKNLIK